MPQRTNDFQTLIKLIETQLAPAGAVVTESKMLIDRRTGRPREVDVLIETRVGGHRVLIGIECTKTKRPVDIQWLERMDSKYKNLEPGVHKVVLVSYSGFAKSVREAANRLGYETLSLEEAVDHDWLRAVNSQSQVYVTFVRFVPRAVGVQGLGKPTNARPLIGTSLSLRSPDGKVFVDIYGFIQAIFLKSDGMAGKIASLLMDCYDFDTGCFKSNKAFARVGFTPHGDWILLDDKGNSFHRPSLTMEFSSQVERFAADLSKFA